MCLIIEKPKGQTIPAWILRTASCDNPHGTGAWITDPKGNAATVEKALDYEGEKKVLAKANRKGVRSIIHFRLATHGDKDLANCHPVEVPLNRRDGYRQWVIHNGIFSGLGHERQTESDTAHFARLVASIGGKDPRRLMTDVTVHDVLALLGGSGNRYVLVDSAGSSVLFHPKLWEDYHGLRCSNTHFDTWRGYGAWGDDEYEDVRPGRVWSSSTGSTDSAYCSHDPDPTYVDGAKRVGSMGRPSRNESMDLLERSGFNILGIRKDGTTVRSTAEAASELPDRWDVRSLYTIAPTFWSDAYWIRLDDGKVMSCSAETLIRWAEDAWTTGISADALQSYGQDHGPRSLTVPIAANRFDLLRAAGAFNITIETTEPEPVQWEPIRQQMELARVTDEAEAAVRPLTLEDIAADERDRRARRKNRKGRTS